MIKKHVWPQSTKLWPFMRVGLAIVLMKYLPILPTCLYQSLRKFNQIFINQSANSSCLHLTSLNKVQQTAIFEWFGREVALVLCSDGSTHRPHRSWPRASRNSFLWRLIINLKVATLCRGITSQCTLKPAKMQTSSKDYTPNHCSTEVSSSKRFVNSTVSEICKL